MTGCVHCNHSMEIHNVRHYTPLGFSKPTITEVKCTIIECKCEGVYKYTHD